MKRKKSRERFSLSLGWPHIREKKIQKTAILLVQELIKYGPILTLTFSIFREREKGKLYIPKKVGHSTFKEIL